MTEGIIDSISRIGRRIKVGRPLVEMKWNDDLYESQDEAYACLKGFLILGFGRMRRWVTVCSPKDADTVAIRMQERRAKKRKRATAAIGDY
ncbi:hypothetical protein PRIPAC_73090 [Pristionchus pacificus]|uniref:Uncharacterized protein n=1 Tax=Pristionchus pacificus TaxID=54126 RepID=A0A2A6CR73_PRIPA|nr:hypothetical protein PRIPAC_73090 [Pristionchus pacificus]|eukprot:PDM80620.1 hypothetical protein PRIPAC_35623 [Pristionchus pacificus]